VGGGGKKHFNLNIEIIIFFIFRSLALDLIIGNPSWVCMTELLVRYVIVQDHVMLRGMRVATADDPYVSSKQRGYEPVSRVCV